MESYVSSCLTRDAGCRGREEKLPFATRYPTMGDASASRNRTSNCDAPFKAIIMLHIRTWEKQIPSATGAEPPITDMADLLGL